jgi:hypothetical protein
VLGTLQAGAVEQQRGGRDEERAETPASCEIDDADVSMLHWSELQD